MCLLAWGRGGVHACVCVCVCAEEKEGLHKCSNWLRRISIFQFLAASCTTVSSVTHVSGYFHSWKRHVGSFDIVCHFPGRYVTSAIAMILFCCHSCTTMTSGSYTQYMRFLCLLQEVLRVAQSGLTYVCGSKEWGVARVDLGSEIAGAKIRGPFYVVDRRVTENER